MYYLFAYLERAGPDAYAYTQTYSYAYAERRPDAYAEYTVGTRL